MSFWKKLLGGLDAVLSKCKNQPVTPLNYHMGIQLQALLRDYRVVPDRDPPPAYTGYMEVYWQGRLPTNCQRCKAAIT
jgi:hypothetical protein